MSTSNKDQNLQIKSISTDRATTPGGHYSQAVAFQGLIFVSGQLGFKPGTSNPVVGTIDEQTRNCLNNVKEILLASNSDLDHIIKVTIYVSDVAHWPEVNRVYAEFFPNHKPARAIVPCNLLHHGFNVEIEAIAAAL